MIKVDKYDKWVFPIAGDFDRHHRFEVPDVEYTWLVDRILRGEFQDSFPDGFKEAFLGKSWMFYGKSGVTLLVRGLVTFPAQRLEEMACRILRGSEESFVRSKEEEFLSRFWSSEEFGWDFSDKLPATYRLLERVYLHSFFRSDGGRERIELMTGPTLTARVKSASLSLCRQKWVRWSVAVLGGATLSTPLLFMYPIIGGVLIAAAKVCSLLVFSSSLNMSLASAFEMSLWLGPTFFLTAFVVHVLVTATVFALTQSLGARYPLLGRVNRLNFIACMTNGAITFFPFVTFAGLVWDIEEDIRERLFIMEVKKGHIGYKNFMEYFSAKLEQRDLPKEGLEPTPGCPE